MGSWPAHEVVQPQRKVGVTPLGTGKVVSCFFPQDIISLKDVTHSWKAFGHDCCAHTAWNSRVILQSRNGEHLWKQNRQTESSAGPKIMFISA